MSDIMVRLHAIFQPLDLNVMSQAKTMQMTLDQVNGQFQVLESSKGTLQDTLQDTVRTGIRAISTIQLLRFALHDVQDIASGKGGLGDILSLASSSLIIINNINQALKSQIILETALNAVRTAGLALGGLSPTVLSVAIGAAVIGGIGVMGGMNQRGLEPMFEEQRLRLQAYRSVVGQ